MFRTIKWYLKFIFSLALHNGELKKADKMLALGKNQEYEDFVYSMVTGWAKDRMNDSGAKVNVYGIENIPTVLYLCAITRAISIYFCFCHIFPCLRDLLQR